MPKLQFSGFTGSRQWARSFSQSAQLGLGVLMLCWSHVAHAQVTVLAEGFEGSFPQDNGWTVGDANGTDGAAFFWDDVNTTFGGEGTQSGSWKGYCAGTRYPLNSLELNPTYDNNMTAFMQRSIDLTPFGCAQLEFWYKTPSIEVCCDALRVWIDGTQVFNQSNAVTAWTQVSIDLFPYLGGVHALRFEFVSDLSITAEGAYLDSIQVTGTLPPGNNNFGAATVIGGASGTAAGNNICATSEVGEPVNSGRTVWWSWTSPVCCPVSFNTFGSPFDTLLCVFTGPNLGALTTVGCNDDAGVGNQSRVDFAAVEATTYWIRVDGYAGGQGNITLNWAVDSAPPANDTFINATALVGLKGTITGHNCNATADADEPFNGLAGHHSIWYSWDSSSACCPVYFSTFGACFDTVICVYTGPNLNGLTQVACNDDAPGKGLASRVTFTSQRFTRYWIQVDGYSSLGGREGQIVLQYGPAGLPPGNDQFAGATVVSGVSGSSIGHNCGATRQDNEPLDFRGGGNTAWYSWTAPANGCTFFNTVGSCFDTVLSVYQGAALNTLTAVAASNDDFPGKSVQSRVEFFAHAGQTYWIQVDGYLGGMGSITLNWGADTTPPLNDNFLGATFLPGTNTGRALGNNCNATGEVGEPANVGRTVWWRWVAPAGGCNWFSTLGSGFDTLLCLYTGATPATLTQVGCADDSAGKGLHSRVEFLATAGTTYWIRVDGFDGAVGDIVLRWGTGPGNDNLADATFLGPAGTILGNNRCATVEAGELNVAPGGGRTIWYRWMAPSTGCPRYFFSSLGSGFDTVLCVFHGAGGVSALILDACNDDFPGKGKASRVEFNVTPGTVYAIRLDGYASAGVAEGDITLTWGPAGTPPPNDNFGAATIITGASGTTAGANCTATMEAGEPADPPGGGKTVWYCWTAPSTTCVFFDTTGSGYDTVLCAYTGFTLPSLTQLDCNDDYPGQGLQSRVEFRAEAGQRYWIAVDGFVGSHGNFNLNWGPDTTPPLNDNFVTLTFIEGSQGSVRGNNCNATGEAGEPGNAGRTVWYCWTAPNTTRFAFRTLGSSFDTLLCVFTGPSVGSLTTIGCVDDTTGKGLASRVEFDAVAGTPYWIRVDGFASAVGDIRLSWGCWPRDFRIALNANHTVTISWADPGYLLQSTPTLLNITNAWTDIPGSSPITLPAAGFSSFYRLQCQPAAARPAD